MWADLVTKSVLRDMDIRDVHVGAAVRGRDGIKGYITHKSGSQICVDFGHGETSHCDANYSSMEYLG